VGGAPDVRAPSRAAPRTPAPRGQRRKRRRAAPAMRSNPPRTALASWPAPSQKARHAHYLPVAASAPGAVPCRPRSKRPPRRRARIKGAVAGAAHGALRSLGLPPRTRPILVTWPPLGLTRAPCAGRAPCPQSGRRARARGRQGQGPRAHLRAGALDPGAWAYLKALTGAKTAQADADADARKLAAVPVPPSSQLDGPR
jgi:hypothetical protein